MSSDNTRPLEPGVTRDFRVDMSYGDYLHLDEVLAAQHLLSVPPHHDELLFIIQHQTSELWLKLVLHELRSVQRNLAAGDLRPALKQLARVKHIQRSLTDQWSVLATLTPSEYAEFRSFLGMSSGFQSYQYRAVEFVLGNKNRQMLEVFGHDEDALAMLTELLSTPSVYDEFLRYLARGGHDVPAALLDRDVTLAHTYTPELVPVFRRIYLSPQEHWEAYEACEELVDLEENFQLWRFRHLKTVERVIGFKRGTGGSSGVGFLRAALDLTFFPELYAVRTEIGLPVTLLDKALFEKALELDEADPLRACRDRFLAAEGVVSYLDGNSLGRPLRAAADRLEAFVRQDWSNRLIRGWTDGWLGWPEQVGDQLGQVALGAAPGQVVVADSTSVMLYKLARAAVDARPDRHEIVLDTDNFPTDRYVLEGIAAERGLTLRWVDTDPAAGITTQQVTAAVGPDTALVVFSHVAYRSGYIADAEAITRRAHEAGALVLWDLSHSVGSVPLELDRWGVDLAVGCTYKYLNGGPGAPAFGYVRTEHVNTLQQPVWGWMGRADIFAMGPDYLPADGVRSVLSGTPPILAMVPLTTSLDLLAEVGMPAVRAKSRLLTAYALELVDTWLLGRGVVVASPRDPDRRGGHLTIRRPDFRTLTERLWERGVIPDFRAPDGIRLGLSPLSTSFAEVHRGLDVLRELCDGD